MEKQKYGVVKIPKSLADAIDKIIQEYPELGYTSTVELVKEAVRLHLSNIKQKRR